MKWTWTSRKQGPTARTRPSVSRGFLLSHLLTHLSRIRPPQSPSFCFFSLSLCVLSFLSHARMSTIFRRHSTIICFFCNSAVTPAPRDPRSFRCPHCDCWNRFDRNGEPISDEPAMHDENLNVPSFAKRGMCGQMLN